LICKVFFTIFVLFLVLFFNWFCPCKPAANGQKVRRQFCVFSAVRLVEGKKKNKKWLDLFFLLHFNLDFLPLFISFLNYCYLPPAWATFKSFFSGLPSISFGFIYLFIPYSTNHKAKKT